MQSADPTAVKRHRTAIGRSDLSMPLRLALSDDVISESKSVFDYGCGRGQDVNRLCQMGVKASGWDPFYAPNAPKTQQDVVMLTYVLNVIEDVEERKRTLAAAWRLAARVLVVSCRLKWEERQVRGQELSDGVLTSRSTFQHFFRTAELRAFVEEVTGQRCVSPAPGVLYVFRRDDDRLSYLARGTIAEFDWAESADYASALAEVVDFTEKRGRPPLFEEIPATVLPLLGRMPRSALLHLIGKAADPQRVSDGTKRSTLDVLLYLGTSIFNGRSTFAELPFSVQADIKHCFKSYREACARADRLLAKISDDTYVRGAMRNSPGKLTATALYVHHRAVSSMPVVLRLYEHCGFIATGRPEGWNVLKLDHRGRRVSWSSYPDFDKDPHPRLAWAYGVEMTSLEGNLQVFEGRANRPLLHRKEEFLSPDDPNVPKYRRLTASEVRAGLYVNPTQIGLEDGWARELERCGVALKGHRLIKR
ncbi:MAG: ribosomal methyltransferase [Gordonia sp.]|nr:ribosomal methyltransferase [Gordonia sp. (in: high G+C Gram-positive bacteria)]